MHINSIKSFAAVLSSAAVLSVPAFADQATAKTQTTTTEAAAPVTPASPDAVGGAAPGVGNRSDMPSQLTEAEILGAVLAVDKNEIAAAARADKKKVGAEAAAYAKLLNDQHSANIETIKSLGKTLGIKPADSKTSKQIQKEGKEELSALSQKNGTDFEKAYIDAMVTGHTETLQLIDDQLLPNAQNESLKSFLTETRGHVAAHLEQGKRLQGARASNVEE